MDLSPQLSAQQHKPDVHLFRSSNKAEPRLHRSIIPFSQSLHMIHCHQITSHPQQNVYSHHYHITSYLLYVLHLSHGNAICTTVSTTLLWIHDTMHKSRWLHACCDSSLLSSYSLPTGCTKLQTTPCCL